MHKNTPFTSRNQGPIFDFSKKRKKAKKSKKREILRLYQEKEGRKKVQKKCIFRVLENQIVKIHFFSLFFHFFRRKSEKKC